MRNYYILSIVLISLLSCGTADYYVEVENHSSVDRVKEIIEIEIDQAAEFAVFDSVGNELPSQVTYQGNLLFPVTVPANSESRYTLRRVERSAIDTVAIGRLYPERIDDLAWENDKIGFRVYSKLAGKDGSKLFGYDIFTKRGNAPVLDHLYAIENNPHDRALVLELRETNPTASKTLSDAISYHIDHGLGMDYYTVGPTMGCGTAALRDADKTIYPTYFNSYEILDKGGLRFSFKLTFDPVQVGDDSIIEERIITLDAGSHFNTVEVFYHSLNSEKDVIVGLVLHDEGKELQIKDQSIAYAEPIHLYGWQTYNAVIFPSSMTPELDLFDCQARTAHNGAYGHLQTWGVIKPNESLKYRMGAGWNRWGFASAQEWFDYVAEQEIVYTKPLMYKIK